MRDSGVDQTIIGEPCTAIETAMLAQVIDLRWRGEAAPMEAHGVNAKPLPIVRAGVHGFAH